MKPEGGEECRREIGYTGGAVEDTEGCGGGCWRGLGFGDICFSTGEKRS